MLGPRLSSAQLEFLLAVLWPEPKGYRAMVLRKYGRPPAHDNPDGWVGLTCDQAHEVVSGTLLRNFDGPAESDGLHGAGQ